MSCSVKILAKSRNPAGVVLETFQLRYWRAIHAELMTHRVFSRCASSSRAVPVWLMLLQVWNDPAGPIHWGVNQSGMQARNQLQGLKLWLCKFLWFQIAAKSTCVVVYLLMKLGLHKQVANRLLEPWQYIHVVVSSTEWENWYALRDHPDAQPEIRELAQEMAEVTSTHKARELKAGEWHLPYISEEVDDRKGMALWPEPLRGLSLTQAIKASVARCARSSYMNHGEKKVDLNKDYALHDRLVDAVPPHMSPTEHQAQAQDNVLFIRNFRGFRQYRDFVELGVKAA